MASIWRLLTYIPECRLDQDASEGQSSSMRSHRVKKEVHRRRSLAGLFTSASPKEPDQDITTLTCEERVHYPLYNPCDPRHNADAFARCSNHKGFWASRGISIRSRLQNSIKSGTKSPNLQQQQQPQQQRPRRSVRSGFMSLTGSSRLMKRFSRSEASSKPHLSSIWEPQSPSKFGIQRVPSNLLLDQVNNSQLLSFPEALSLPRPYLLPSLPSMSSGLMSPLELEACTTAGYTEQEKHCIQNYHRRPHTFNRPLQPLHILRNTVPSMSSGQYINQGRPGYTKTSNTISENDKSLVSITPKRPPLNRQQARALREGDYANFRTLLSKQMQKKDEGKTSENLGNVTKLQSLLNLGEQWLETRRQPLRVVSPGISQPSTATDSEFGVDMYRTSAKHRYASTTESDAVLGSWLSSLSSVSHTRDNTDISGSTLCRSPPPTTKDPSQAKQTGSFSTPALRWQAGCVERSSSSRSQTRHCHWYVASDKDARNKHEGASTEFDSPRPGITTEPARQKTSDNTNSVRNLRQEVGMPLELPKATLHVHLNSTDNPDQLSSSPREQLCENALETEANEGDFWPSSNDTHVELNQPPKSNGRRSLALNRHGTGGHGKVESAKECQSAQLSHAEETRPPSYRGNAKERNVSHQDATNGVMIPTCKTSYVPCLEPAAYGSPTPGERTGSHATGENGSKSPSSRKDGSSSGSGSGSGGSGQSDPLTNSTAGTSVIDFVSDQKLAMKTKAEERPASPEMGIKALPANGDAVLLKN